ncbi:hypothetical protein [Hymenobacter sp. B81]|uniref:hypothetical protein n=1 Tax=Hymenobacter sp. B81 TaxID=3344878 RepID=UPI0037DC78C7
MSDIWINLLIPACLLASYPPMLLTARFWPKHQSPRLLKWVHLGGWGLVLLQIGAMGTWRLSLRGQWLDMLPFGLAWLAAGSYFALRRRQMGWAGKFYFGGWFAYPAALVGAYLLDRIFFVLVSIPIILFIPDQELYSGPQCAIRSGSGGFLAPPRLDLVTPFGPLLEKHRGFVQRNEANLAAIKTISAAQVLTTPASDTTAVMLIGPTGRRHILYFLSSH